MKYTVILVLSLALAGVAEAAGARQWTLTQGQWSGVTSAAQVVRIAPLRAAVEALDAEPGSRLVVIHNGGEDGLFWAADLKGWLVALGVPTARIVDRIGVLPPGRIHLRLQPPGGP